MIKMITNLELLIRYTTNVTCFANQHFEDLILHCSCIQIVLRLPTSSAKECRPKYNAELVTAHLVVAFE